MKSMWNQTNLMIVVGVLVVAGMVFAYLQRRDMQRIRRTDDQIREYLTRRFGVLPAVLSIHSSHDALWPVLVRFTDVASNTKYRLQFAGSGASPLKVLSEQVEA
jgi:hypothetical protein